jgi:hypothetical protein
MESLALAGGKLIQLNPHLISTHDAGDRAYADNGPRAGRQLHSHVAGAPIGKVHCKSTFAERNTKEAVIRRN